MKSAQPADLLRYLEVNGPTRSAELTDHFGISRATLSRRLKALEDTVLIIGKGKATRIAARHRDFRGPLPLYRVSGEGKCETVGELVPAQTREWVLQTKSAPPALFGEVFKDGLFPGWPWFLEDLRPSGFLGRAFARRMEKLFGFDRNIDRWSDLQLATALGRFGDKLQGNFIIGQPAVDAFLERKVRIAEGYYRNTSPATYPDFAERALEHGEEFGSSAGGEQQKFTALVCENPNTKPRAVIVKFSSPVDNPTARRWADLLHAEHLANRVLGKEGFETASTRILEYGNRVFLESGRFDRIGANGRRGLVTLRALDAAYGGHGGGTWADCARELCASGRITDQDRDTIGRLHAFGSLIANTDMHFGNLSFFLADTLPHQLAPVYDMLPMGFRPGTGGEIRDDAFRPELPRPADESAWLEMWPVAVRYWREVSDAPGISTGFQKVARDALAALQRIHKTATA